ncbi:MAG TPA: fumarylacetoacetate hydrolase family protein [Steroidobacteraceae bacterium]|nr:fumarylacetoacetate hydrolase family protein [Steroidobacteraceae bacterium]
MRLVTFSSGADSPSRLGALSADGARVVDLGALAQRRRVADPQRFASMLELVRAGRAALDLAKALLAESAHEGVERGSVRLDAPLPLPEQLRCFSAFEEHSRRSSPAMLKLMAAHSPAFQAAAERAAQGTLELPKLWYERPLYYKANRFSVVGTDRDIQWPGYSAIVDFELELGCVIGATGKDVAGADAGTLIFGYTLCNDLSARDAQAIEMQAPLGPAKSKDFDGGLAMGPCIVTADEFDRRGADTVVRVNGEEWARGTASNMHHSFEAMIAYVSQSETLHAGEMLLSGCVGGGSGTELGRYPARGDVIELEMKGIGVLRNRII